jgi:hypothetical protein
MKGHHVESGGLSPLDLSRTCHGISPCLPVMTTTILLTSPVAARACYGLIPGVSNLEECRMEVAFPILLIILGFVPDKQLNLLNLQQTYI